MVKYHYVYQNHIMNDLCYRNSHRGKQDNYYDNNNNNHNPTNYEILHISAEKAFFQFTTTSLKCDCHLF